MEKVKSHKLFNPVLNVGWCCLFIGIVIVIVALIFFPKSHENIIESMAVSILIFGIGIFIVNYYFKRIEKEKEDEKDKKIVNVINHAYGKEINDVYIKLESIKDNGVTNNRKKIRFSRPEWRNLYEYVTDEMQRHKFDHRSIKEEHKIKLKQIIEQKYNDIKTTVKDFKEVVAEIQDLLGLKLGYKIFTNTIRAKSACISFLKDENQENTDKLICDYIEIYVFALDIKYILKKMTQKDDKVKEQTANEQLGASRGVVKEILIQGLGDQTEVKRF
jgi:hypothetical protein